jgi:hypothetical protein
VGLPTRLWGVYFEADAMAQRPVTRTEIGVLLGSLKRNLGQAGPSDPYFAPMAGYTATLQRIYDMGQDGVTYFIPRPPTCGICRPPQ